jgi:hypothetical protein
MAELAAQGKFHEVDNAEADAIIEASTHQILHNEAIGRGIRNIYGRIQALEKEVSDLKATLKSTIEKPTQSVPP